MGTLELSQERRKGISLQRGERKTKKSGSRRSNLGGRSDKDPHTIGHFYVLRKAILIMAQVTDLAPVPPPPGGDNKVTMSREIKALIECYMRDAKAFDFAALRAEQEAAADRNAQKPYSSATARMTEYRERARGEIAALVALVRHQYPHLSLEQRCDVIQANTSLSGDDVNRIWNALLAVTA